MSNNAAAALAFPVALGVAAQLGLDPKPFVMAVLYGASCSFHHALRLPDQPDGDGARAATRWATSRAPARRWRWSTWPWRWWRSRWCFPSNDGVRSCLLPPLHRGDQPTHPRHRKPAPRRQRRHRDAFVPVGAPKRLRPLRRWRRPRSSLRFTATCVARAARRPPLDARHLRSRRRRRPGQRLHALDKGAVTQVDLLLQRPGPQLQCGIAASSAA